jgi:hypothetical protein
LFKKFGGALSGMVHIFDNDEEKAKAEQEEGKNKAMQELKKLIK